MRSSNSDKVGGVFKSKIKSSTREVQILIGLCVCVCVCVWWVGGGGVER